MDGTQIKVHLPIPLYQWLSREASRTGRTRAEIVRELLAERYRNEVVELSQDNGGGHLEPAKGYAGIPVMQEC